MELTYEFECEECGHEALVVNGSLWDARAVLLTEGWIRGDDGVVCPDCKYE